MIYKIVFSKKSRKSFKRLRKSGRFDPKLNAYVINVLAKGEILEEKFKDHVLVGEYSGYKECHIKNDLLLIYKIDADDGALFIEDIGSHSELFG